MLSRHGARLLGAGAILAAIAFGIVAARADKQEKQDEKQTVDHKALREALTKKHNDGNYKDAYEGLRKLALDADNDPKLVGKDLDLALSCLRRLGRLEDIDEFREAVIAKHSKNWRLLETAALSFRSSDYRAYNERYGYVVGGKFHRGPKRGGVGKYVNTMQRDRVRALQLMNDAMTMVEKDDDKAGVAQFYLHHAELLSTASPTTAPGGSSTTPT